MEKKQMRYRLYIDESGDCSYKCGPNSNRRFLSLTGVIIKEYYARHIVKPKIEGLKSKYFRTSTETSITLHRSDIINKKGPFSILHDPKINNAFETDLLSLFKKLHFSVITVVIDKLDHLNKYTVWQADPYHYCLEILLERYYWFLKKDNAVGDVMIEGRSKKQDKRLNKAYSHFYTRGTSYIKNSELQAYLTSNEIKIKKKQSNIIGLQIADILAHPSNMATIAIHFGRIQKSTFGAKLVDILNEEKYYRSSNGDIEGYGRKWLP